MFFEYISLHIFLISFSIGLFFVYLSNPPPKIIYIYPTPENSGKVRYKDDASNCFNFRSTEVPCKDADDIKTIPMQHVVDNK